MKTMRFRRHNGFTIVEMLVIIGIIGILSMVLLNTFSRVQESARKLQAQNLVNEAATAFSRYLQDHREWPQEFLIKEEMDDRVCKVFQEGKYMDVTPYKMKASGTITSEINNKSLDRFGLLDPWAQRSLKGRPSASETDPAVAGYSKSFAEHRLQYRLDRNLDGFVNSQDGETPEGVSVRASAIVWSRGRDGEDDFRKSGQRYPKDDSLSWPHHQYKASGN